jgi:cytochrome P450
MTIEGLPPGPGWPRAAQTLAWATRPVSLAKHCRERYGDFFTVRTFGLGDMVFVSDPELIKQVFTGDRDVYHAGEANSTMEPVLGPHSLLILDGDRHLHERKLLLPPFHGEAVRGYAERVRELAAEEVAGWPLGKAFPVRPRMQAITLEVILRVVMGVRDPARLDRLRELLPKLLDFNVLDMWSVWLFPKVMDTFLARRHKSMRVRPEIDRLIAEEIADHRARPEGRDDVLALLVAARDEDGAPLSDAALRDHLITLLLAGHETTTTGLAWTFERLVRHPDKLERLNGELAAGDGDNYLDAVINETLRVRPVIDGVWRRLTRATELNGYRLPAGTTVLPSIALVQLSEGFDDPEQFRPERFLGDGPPPYTFIPFGGGARRCIGAAFAIMEMKVVLREALARVRLQTTDEPGEPPRSHHVTLVPKRGGRVVLERA